MRILMVVISVAAALGLSDRVETTTRLDRVSATHTRSRAAPWAIVFSGPLLRHRVVISDRSECMSLMPASSNSIPIGSQELRGRPEIAASMFWGPDWQHLSTHPESLATLDTSRATQRGIFYPAHRGRAALWVFGPAFGAAGRTSVMTADGLAILKRHGVPTSVD